MEQVIAGTLDVEGETGRESRTPDGVAMGGQEKGQTFGAHFEN